MISVSDVVLLSRTYSHSMYAETRNYNGDFELLESTVRGILLRTVQTNIRTDTRQVYSFQEIYYRQTEHPPGYEGYLHV